MKIIHRSSHDQVYGTLIIVCNEVSNCQAVTYNEGVGLLLLDIFGICDLKLNN